MLQPTRHGENPVLLKEFADLRFPDRCIFYPAISIFRKLKRRDIFVALLLIAFKRNRPIPFLLSHRQDLLRGKRIERDVFEKENVSIASEGRFFWRRWQSILQICSK